MLTYLKHTRQTDRSMIINSVIMAQLDNLYIGLHINKPEYTKRSVAHLIKIRDCNRTAIRNTIALCKLNEVETITTDQLSQIDYHLSSSPISTVFGGLHTESILTANRSPLHSTEYQIMYAKLILALCGIDDFNEMNAIVVPSFTSQDSSYTINLVRFAIPLSISSNRNGIRCSNARSINDLVSQLRSSDISLDRVIPLFKLINIDVLPDYSSGIGITKTTIEKKISSDKANQYFSHVIGSIGICDTMRPSLEADFTDTVDPGGSDVSDDNTKDKSIETDETTTKLTTDDPVESTEDQPVTDPSNPDNPQPGQDQIGGENNTDDAKGMFGLNLELPKNETLDDFLYKMTVASKIDEIVAFNHDKLSTEVVSVLQRWKSLFLFLVAVSETKKILSKFKVKII